MEPQRREFLRLGSLAALGAVAGCSGQQEAAPTATDTASPSPERTRDGGAVQGPPGADGLGGPNDLQPSATVDATVLAEDQGAGRFVNTPAVVWVESGATVSWNSEGAAHSVTAYHPDNDRPLRIPESADAFDSGDLSAGETFEHAFETPGVYNYFCRPHEGLGMVGLVIVDGPRAGPGTTPPEAVSGAGTALERILDDVAGVLRTGDAAAAAYTWEDATWDSYWYSLYNMSTNISMSGNGVRFPHNEQQQQALDEWLPAMLEAAGQGKPPIKDPYLNMAAFTEGDPHFTQDPVFDAGDGRPDASTLRWVNAESSDVVSPSSLGWTHLKGVTWAKNFENHFDVLPDSLAAEFRSEVLSTLAQIGVNAALIAGGPQGNGALTKGESMELVSGFKPASGEVVDETARPNHHSAMLWFLSDLTSLSTGGWFGYENPEPLIPAEKIQGLSDGLANATMDRFPATTIVEMGSTRDLGQMLGAIGWYGTHAGNDQLVASAGEYADALAARIETAIDGNGRVAEGSENQAATQGMIGQGLIWASQVDGVDHTGLAEDALDYLVDALWDDDAGTFASAEGADEYPITARDAGDITGGLNAADAVLGLSGIRERFARFFDQTFNRDRLQRAERPPSHDPKSEHPLPLPPKAGGEYGQAAVYNGAVRYDTGADEWSVTDDRFYTEQALYLANQDIWIGQWAGDFFQGRGVPGQNDAPE